MFAGIAEPKIIDTLMKLVEDGPTVLENHDAEATAMHAMMIMATSVALAAVKGTLQSVGK